MFGRAKQVSTYKISFYINKNFHVFARSCTRLHQTAPIGSNRGRIAPGRTGWYAADGGVAEHSCSDTVLITLTFTLLLLVPGLRLSIQVTLTGHSDSQYCRR